MPDPLFFQMEPDLEEDFVSKLMGNDPGGRTFFASCLLCLNPEELKACRLVNSVWAKFIMDEVWKRSRGRKRLEGKLVERWKSVDPRTVELGQMRESVWSMCCNDAFVFCGLESRIVAVYSLTTGQWVRDLSPGQVVAGFGRHARLAVSGNKTVVAASFREPTVTVWSSQGKMEQLYYFNATNQTCQDVNCLHEGADRRSIWDIKVVGSKVALLVRNFEKHTIALVVIRKGEHIWEENTLTCFSQASFPIPSQNVTDFLAVDGDWISVTKWPSGRVSLWQDDTYRQDINLPGLPTTAMDSPFLLKEHIASAIDFPFLILSVREKKGRASIKVFRLAADNEISTVASLVKSIPFGDRVACRIISNQLFFGFVSYLHPTGKAVTLIEKRALVDAAVANTEMNRINLLDSFNCLDMNSTCLVFARHQGFVLKKKDFWMANTL